MRKGWTEETIEKLRAAGKKGAAISNKHRPECQCRWCIHPGHPIGVMAGPNNPNWQGGKSPAFGVGWKAARRIVWERDKVCQKCGLPPEPKRRLDVHHIVTRRNGGTNDPENLIGLHRSCHMKIHGGTMNKKCETFGCNNEGSVSYQDGPGTRIWICEDCMKRIEDEDRRNDDEVYFQNHPV